jgi:hypothetical protein
MLHLILAILLLGQTPPDSGAKQPAPSDTTKAVPVPPDTATAVPIEESTAATPKSEHDFAENIKGTERLKIEELKPQFFPMIDPYEPINSLLKAERYVFDDKLYSAIDSLTIPSHYLHSSFLRIPVVDRLIKGDVLIFLPKFEKNVATWELVVSNSLGETVRRIRRKGNPPNLITWDGRDDQGRVINTGETYDFTFYAYDAVGNQTRIPGRPQRILGMMYQDAGEWIVTIAGDEVFEKGSTQLSASAKRWLDEATNLVKEKFKSEAVVYVYTEREALSTDQCDIVVAELVRRQVMPKDAVKSAPRFIPGLQPKFSKVEIHVR